MKYLRLDSSKKKIFKTWLNPLKKFCHVWLLLPTSTNLMCLELIAREQKSQVGKPTEFLNLARNHFIEILLRNTLAKDPFPDIWHCGDSWYGGVWMGTHYAGENVSEYFKGEMIFWIFFSSPWTMYAMWCPLFKTAFLSGELSSSLGKKIDNDHSCGIAISNPVAWS